MLNPSRARALHRAFAAKAGDLLPLADFAGVLLASYSSLLAYVALHEPLLTAARWKDLSPLAWVAAVVAPFLLYERSFAAWAGGGDRLRLVRSFAGRFLMFLSVTSAIAFAGRWFDRAPIGWLVLWVAGAVLLSALSRILLASYLHRLEERGALADVAVGTGGCTFPPRLVRHVGDTLPVQLIADRPIRRWNAVLKSLEDTLLGTMMMVLLLPVLAGIALAIKLDSRGPVLFKQRRHGINNREFDIYKFRTMHRTSGDSGAALKQTVRGDSRITRVGRFLRRFSLDELPQVFNVLQGDMSLVGPRPHAVNMRTEEQLGHEVIDVYPHRHRVKPGISGWSQINGYRGATHTVAQLRRRVELDLHYVENWSLGLDLKILIRTFREVVRATNAY